MKTPVRILVLSLVATLFLSIVGLTKTEAQSVLLTDEQLQRISANCQAIKNTLTQLRQSDTLLRINRGQRYESLGAKLINNFNARVSRNGFDNKGLLVVSDSYQAALAAFRTDYQAYDMQLTATLRIDCEKQPAEFHSAVLDAREKRAKVHQDVTKLHQYIDDYRSAANDFLINFERLSGGGR